METGFIKRERKINVIKFLELLFKEPGSITEKSLTELCSSLDDIGISISKQGLDKRFNKNAVTFMREIFLSLFQKQTDLSMNKMNVSSTLDFNSIRILDGTSVKLPEKLQSLYPGTVGAGVKFQVEFDFLTGTFSFIEMQAAKAADSPSGMRRLESLKEKDLFLQDLGYFKYDLFETINKEKAFYISRAKSDTMFYKDNPNPRYRKNGDIIKQSSYERLLLEEELKTLKSGETREYCKVYLGKHKRLPVRLLAYRMTKKEQKNQEQRIKRRKQTKSGNIKQKSYDMASISTFITNLPIEVPATEIIELYRYRWQVELIFKTWKSHMKVDHYREMKVERWECHLYAELILLLFSTLVTYQLRAYLKTANNFVLSEQIAMNEISKQVWKLWQARDDLEWDDHMKRITKKLTRIGQKNIKKKTAGQS